MINTKPPTVIGDDDNYVVSSVVCKSSTSSFVDPQKIVDGPRSRFVICPECQSAEIEQALERRTGEN